MASAPLTFLKSFLWLTFGLMLVSVFVLVDLPIFQPANPNHARMSAALPVLLPHALAAITAILLGPLQFSSRFRRKYLKLHRVVGKVYVICVLVAAPAAALLASHAPGLLPFAGAVQSTLWVATTVAAFLTARNRQITQHRQWMVRSYGVGCTIFVMTRLPVPLAFLHPATPDGVSMEILLLMLLALFIPELVWSWKAIAGRTPAPAGRSVAQASDPVLSRGAAV
jgi:uncharacterized membrane protein